MKLISFIFNIRMLSLYILATAFGITAVGLIYQLLAPGFWYSFYVDVTRGRAASFPAMLGWTIGMFVPFFNFSQLYIDITLKTSGSVDPGTGKYVAGDCNVFTAKIRVWNARFVDCATGRRKGVWWLSPNAFNKYSVVDYGHLHMDASYFHN